MSYTKQTWEDLPSLNTPITANRLNHMEDGIDIVNTLEDKIGTLTELETTNKTNLVDAINENVDSIDVLKTYSSAETKVGIWIDNKPIYRKVISLGLLPNNTTKRVASGISNLEYVTQLYGTALAGTYFITLPDSYPNQTQYGIRLSYDLSTNEIVILSASDRSTYSGYAIIEYTKTTD